MKRIITCIVCVAMAFCGTFFNVFGTLDKRAEDVFYHNPETVDTKIKIIKIDDETMSVRGIFYLKQRCVC